MGIKGYYILSLEAKDIYGQEQLNGVEKGYSMPSKKGHAYLGLFDESLFLENYPKRHMRLLRNKFFKACGFKTKFQKWFKDKNSQR